MPAFKDEGGSWTVTFSQGGMSRERASGRSWNLNTSSGFALIGEDLTNKAIFRILLAVEHVKWL